MEEQVKRTKGMLRLYGSYTREIQKLQKRLDEINEAIAWHQDWPEQAAKECGIHRLDPKHPAVQRMIIEQATLESQIKKVCSERDRLDLDPWLNSLSLEDRYIIHLVFIDGNSYQMAAPLVNLSKSGLRDRINQICSRIPHACG